MFTDGCSRVLTDVPEYVRVLMSANDSLRVLRITRVLKGAHAYFGCTYGCSRVLTSLYECQQTNEQTTHVIHSPVHVIIIVASHIQKVTCRLKKRNQKSSSTKFNFPRKWAGELRNYAKLVNVS